MNGGSGFQGKQAAEENACLGTCAMILGTELSTGFDAGIGISDDAPHEAGFDERVSPVAGLDVHIREGCLVVPTL
jgi:hypothetical protein